MTEQDLEEWREHPVSRMVRDCLKHNLDREHESMTRAYWAGNAPPEEARLAYLRKLQLWTDLFEADLADFSAEMMKGDE